MSFECQKTLIYHPNECQKKERFDAPFFECHLTLKRMIKERHLDGFVHGFTNQSLTIVAARLKLTHLGQ